MQIQKGDLLYVKARDQIADSLLEVGIVFGVGPPEPGSPFWVISYYSSSAMRIVYESFEDLLQIDPRAWVGRLQGLRSRRHT